MHIVCHTDQYFYLCYSNVYKVNWHAYRTQLFQFFVSWYPIEMMIFRVKIARTIFIDNLIENLRFLTDQILP